MDALEAVGFTPRWQALLAEHGTGVEPGRVLRHDGGSVVVRARSGDRVVALRPGLPTLTVGDWLAVEGERAVAVLPRSSLLRRRAAGGDDEQLLAANVDLVLLVAGLDRPLKAGRIQRGEALAYDAGALPLLVLTKADVADDLAGLVARVAAEHPLLEIVVTSAATGDGLAELRARMAGVTSVLLGESGAGKSRLVNALAGDDVAGVGAVRAGDHKGRHTTTSRSLHVLPTGGVVIDSPGIRQVGLATDEDAVDAAFADIAAIAPACRFGDCRHAGEPGCAVVAAVESGRLAADRLDAYHQLRAEAVAAARRADEHERRAYERRFTKQVKDFVRSDHYRKQ